PSERERADLLKLLARDFFHSRESNLAHKKPSASTISTFCGRGRLLDNDVNNTWIGADGWSIKQIATIDAVRILAKDLLQGGPASRPPTRSGGLQTAGAIWRS